MNAELNEEKMITQRDPATTRIEGHGAAEAEGEGEGRGNREGEV